MRRVQNRFVRWFNRRRRRDGPLFRGRFCSYHVNSVAYELAVLRYIDVNSVDGGLVTNPADYPHSSAWHFARPGPRPRWLSRRQAASLLGEFTPNRYREFCASSVKLAGLAWVVKRSRAGSMNTQSFKSLLDAAPPRLRARFGWKAELADGTRSPPIVVTPELLTPIIQRRKNRQPIWEIPSSRKRTDAWTVLSVTLHRELSRLTYSEIARVTEISISKVRCCLLIHERWMLNEHEYREKAGSIAAEVLDRQQVELLGDLRVES